MSLSLYYEVLDLKNKYSTSTSPYVFPQSKPAGNLAGNNDDPGIRSAISMALHYRPALRTILGREAA
jgi:hypothetical protein